MECWLNWVGRVGKCPTNSGREAIYVSNNREFVGSSGTRDKAAKSGTAGAYFYAQPSKKCFLHLCYDDNSAHAMVMRFS